jgi:hypothetical protein
MDLNSMILRGINYMPPPTLKEFAELVDLAARHG